MTTLTTSTRNDMWTFVNALVLAAPDLVTLDGGWKISRTPVYGASIFIRALKLAWSKN